MIEIKIMIDDIDYDTAADVLLPIFAEQFVNGNDNPMLKQLFSGGQRLSASAAKSFISIMPQRKKDELVVRYLNANKEKISEQLMQYGAKNNVKLTIKNIESHNV